MRRAVQSAISEMTYKRRIVQRTAMSLVATFYKLVKAIKLFYTKVYFFVMLP